MVGGGNSGVEEGLFLTQFAERIRLIEFMPELKASAHLQERARANPKFTIQTNTEFLEFRRGRHGKLGEVIARDRASGEVSRFSPAGAFVFVGLDPNTEFLHESLELDRWGFVVTDEEFQTSLPGVFAAGDVRAGSTKQLGVATGEGIGALLATRRFLDGTRTAELWPVAGGAPSDQPQDRTGGEDRADPDAQLRVDRGRDRDVRQVDVADDLRRRGESDLRERQRQRGARPDARICDAARGRLEPAREIQRAHRRPLVVRPPDQPRGAPAGIAVERVPEQGVEREVGLGGLGPDRNIHALQDRELVPRYVPESAGVVRENHAHPHPTVGEMTGGDEPATPVATATAKHDDRAGPEPAENQLGHPRAGILHHLVQEQPELLDGQAVDLAHLLGRDRGDRGPRRGGESPFISGLAHGRQRGGSSASRIASATVDRSAPTTSGGRPRRNGASVLAT